MIKPVYKEAYKELNPLIEKNKPKNVNDYVIDINLEPINIDRVRKVYTAKGAR